MDPNRLVPVEICSNTLKFAKCSSFKCPKRHAFIDEIDQPKFLPTKGTLKVTLLAVRSPCHYIVKVDEIKHSDIENWISWKSRNDEIELMLKEFHELMTIDKNAAIHATIEVGDICAYFSAKEVKWYRAKVLSKE
jgi:hypothetical protein